MNWPHKIDVIIDDDGKDKEVKAKFLRFIPFAQSGEYETDQGERFCIDVEYLQGCQAGKLLPRIPVEVIRQNAESREKLETAQKFLNKQEKEKQTGLILPPC